MMGGILGVVFMVPLRKALIVDRQDLVYPEGVACSEVLIVGQEGGAGIKWIGWGLGIGAIFKYLVSGFMLIRGTVEGAFAMGRSAFYFGSDMSVALLGVGYIVNLNIASQVFAGGIIGWVIAIPLMGGIEAGDGSVLDTAWTLWSTQVRYMGVGAMLVGGLWSIFSVRKGILAGLGSLRNVAPTGEGEVLRTERNMPLTALFTVFILAAVGTVVLYDFLIGDHFIALVAGIVMLLASFLFVAVATYIVGLVGSSNSPVSGMTICALLLTAGVLLALGVKGDSAILATLGVAGVVCCAACTSGDIAQDLKTGHLIGATPARQQWVELVAVVVPVFIFAPVMSFLHKAYVIGSPELLAPQAALFASLTNGFFGDGEIPWTMVIIGASIGAGIIVLDAVLQQRKSSIRVHVMPVAVGIYLPLALGVPIFLGGLIRHFTSPRKQEAAAEAQDHGILFGSGLIAGEALMGIGLAIPISMSWTFITFEGVAGVVPHFLISLAFFAAVIGAYFRISRRR